MNTRRKKILRTGSILLGAGLLYAFVVQRIGFGIPCPFHALTGLRCPGCGVSRMCLALLRGDLGEAFVQNRCVLLLLPVLGYVAAAWCVGYVRRGERLLHGSAKAAAVLCAAALLFFGAVRNFIGW